MHFKENTDDAEVLPRRLAYPKMAASQPNAYVIRNRFAAYELPVAAAQRDDEETIPSIGNNMTQWRGNAVSEKEANALRYVFDDLQDHFGYQCVDPRVRFNNTNLKHPGNSGKWFGDLDFTYNIKGDHCNLSYIGIDVCVDLAPKLVHKHGQPMWKDYGKSFLYVYLPQLTYNKFKSYVKFGTGWDVSDEGTVYDPNRDMVAIEAKVQSGQSEPSFWAAKEKPFEGAGDRSFSRIGTIQDVKSHSSQQRIHRGVGIFSVSMEVEGTPNFKPSPQMGDEIDLCFTLVSLRTWGTTDGIAPIVYVPHKEH